MSVVATILLVRRGGNETKVLLQKKDDHPVHGNKWSMFGGHVEKGESPQDAIRREVREELGIRIMGFMILGKPMTFMFGNTQFHVFTLPFEAPLSGISLGEGGGFALFCEAELADLHLIEEDREIIKYFFRNPW